MSSSANGKKSSSSSSGNTPATTPAITANGNQQQQQQQQLGVVQTSPPPNNNAPKYGTLVPNRIFVGGISANTTEGELLQLFSNYGTVKAAKIIQDRAGVSKGYGFITFESEDDAKRPLREADNIVLRERKLNIAPAIKKQLSFSQPFNFNRAFEASSPPVAVGNSTQYYLPPGAMPYFQGSVGYYAPPPSAPAPGDPTAQPPTPAIYQPPPVYPAQTGPPQAATYPSMMFPAQTIYMPQQYPMHIPYDYNYYPNNGAAAPCPAQYVVANGAPGAGPPTSSGSPPHPPCYGQQFAYATAAGAPTVESSPMFYNMHLYSGCAIEQQPAIFTDGLETAPNTFAEDPFMGPPPQQQHQDALLDNHHQLGGSPPSTNDYTVKNHYNHHSMIAATSSPPVLLNGTAVINNHHHHLAAPPKQEQSRFCPEIDDPTTTLTTATTTTKSRQTETPVVSLLSFDYIQEKDLNSMQGGRKKKPLPPPPQTMNMSSMRPQQTQPHPPVNGFPNFQPPSSEMIPLDFRNFQPSYQYSYYKPTYNGYGPRRPQTFRRQTDWRQPNNFDTHTSNVDDKLRTSVTTPPPAPYSPLTNYGYTSRFSNNYNGFYRGKTATYNNNNNNDNRRGRIPYSGYTNNNNAYIKQTDGVAEISHNENQNDMNPSQVQFCGSFGTQARRGRRGYRRGNNGEMGAGDAPPLLTTQNSDVALDKKLETLKL